MKSIFSKTAASYSRDTCNNLHEISDLTLPGREKQHEGPHGKLTWTIWGKEIHGTDDQLPFIRGQHFNIMGHGWYS